MYMYVKLYKYDESMYMYTRTTDDNRKYNIVWVPDPSVDEDNHMMGRPNSV